MATVQYKTPGVYLSEPDSFPPAVVGVDTAVPAFIGYTQKASDKGKTLNLTPVRLTSMADYIERFGGPYRETYKLIGAADKPAPADLLLGTVTLDEGSTHYQLVEDGQKRFNLYSAMKIFFANGGGTCYVVSVGNFDATIGKPDILNGLNAIKNVVGPTMLVVPDAVLLPDQDDCSAVQVEMLNQCNAQRDRVAILDVWGTGKLKAGDPTLDVGPTILAFRQGLAGAHPEWWRYGIAYFPDLNTSIMGKTDVDITFFDKSDVLTKALTDAVDHFYPSADPAKPDPRNAAVKALVAAIPGAMPNDNPAAAKSRKDRGDVYTVAELTQALLANLSALGDLFSHVAESQNTLPPSGAMAGVITSIDADRGVWNAPANVGIATLVAPSVEINSEQQQDLNAPTEGLAINAIRTFPARGPLIWGARTLDSTSNDWRYIQVRRTMIYIESSVKTALNAFVFAPNTASTWTTVESMVSSFLHGVWAAGGLMGASPAEAYNVSCGLGKTMTGDDILLGNMIVNIVLTMVHPAEFIELVFRQQMLGGS